MTVIFPIVHPADARPPRVPALVAATGERASYRFFEFFTRFPACQKRLQGSAHGWHC